MYIGYLYIGNWCICIKGIKVLKVVEVIEVIKLNKNKTIKALN